MIGAPEGFGTDPTALIWCRDIGTQMGVSEALSEGFRGVSMEIREVDGYVLTEEQYAKPLIILDEM